MESQLYLANMPHNEENKDGEENTPQSARRGRPIGSRNKPKEIPLLYKESDDAMMPHVVQIQHGADIVKCLGRFYQRLQTGGLYVMSALGNVVDVTMSMAGSVRSFRGIYNIISLSGLYLPHCNSLSISVADSEGKVISGMVEGILGAAGPVTIVVGSCADPFLHRVRPISGNGEEGSGNTAYPRPSFPDPTSQTLPDL